MIKLTLTENQANQRLDRFMKKYFDGAPLSLIYKMLRKDVKVNGKRVSGETMLSPGDELTLYLTESQAAALQRPKKTVRAKRQFGIAYEDGNILIAEKPFGLLTHGDSSEKKNHLANQVIDYLIQQGEYDPRTEKTFTPAPVNRLDRNTTGLVIFGKNARAVQDLAAMVRDKSAVSKRYLTIVTGKLTQPMELRDRMTKDEHNNTVAVLDESSGEGKLMETRVFPLSAAKYGKLWYTLCEVEILTGRTHQIRAHLAKAGCPVIGDSKYGTPAVNREVEREFGRTTQLLHAYKLIFHRVPQGSPLIYMTGREIVSQLPPDFQSIIEKVFGSND